MLADVSDLLTTGPQSPLSGFWFGIHWAAEVGSSQWWLVAACCVQRRWPVRYASADWSLPFFVFIP